MKEIAKEIFDLLDPKNSLSEFLGSNNLNLNGSHLIGMGKPAAHYTKILTERFQFESTLCLVKDGHQIDSDFPMWIHDHPEVTPRNFQGTIELQKYLQQLSKDQVITFLITGGASALISKPVIAVDDFLSLWKFMLYEGWPIEEMNQIRILMDEVKGGGLLKSLSGQKVVNLYVSDVPVRHFDFVSSSPTNPVKLDQDQLEKIMRKLPEKYQESISKLMKSYIPVEYSVENYLIESASNLGHNAKNIIQKKYPDYKIILDPTLTSETPKDFIGRLPQLESKTVFISVGETGIDSTSAKGKGGRNSHLAAFMQKFLKPAQEFFSLASDGNDGNSNAAGGWSKYEKNVDQDLDEYLEDFDTATWLDQKGQLFKFGPSPTNLMDLRVLVQHE